MAEVARPHPPIKKPIKKIRREFLPRVPTENPPEEEEIVEYQKNYHYDVPYQLMIDMMDFNTKLCRDEANFDHFQAKIGQFKFKESDSGKKIILDIENSSSVKLTLNGFLRERTRFCPDSATKFEKIYQELNENYQTLMQRYLEVVNNPDEKVQIKLKKINRKARKTIDYIDSRFPAYKTTSFADKESVKIIDFSYNENFVKKLGYSFLEFFQTYANCNAGPVVVSAFNNGITAAFGNILNTLLHMLDDQKPHMSSVIKNCTLRGINNSLLNCSLQLISVFEPRHNGFIFHAYFVCHDMKSVLI